jgi:hypothetical protein
MQYLKHLEQRGYQVELTEDSRHLRITPPLAEHLKPQVQKFKPQIIAELLATAPPPAQPEHVPGDPRPDMTADHRHWQRLLADIAWGAPVYYELHGFRCCGARLARREGEWRILYDAKTTDGFRDKADFDTEFNRWLGSACDDSGTIPVLQLLDR